ncbi:PEP-CTERM sorting domain-containing protein [Planctomycetota bacterium]|nr:PEP-CTERM sorting domain-containing protein [Planctomycetota bacterium]
MKTKEAASWLTTCGFIYFNRAVLSQVFSSIEAAIIYNTYSRFWVKFIKKKSLFSEGKYMSIARVSFATAALLSAVLSTGIHASPFNTIVMTGDDAGVGATTFEMFDRIDLNNHGQMVFQAIADDSAADDMKTYVNFYVDANGQKQLIDFDTNNADWFMTTTPLSGSGLYDHSYALPLYQSQINDHGTIAYIKLTEAWNGNQKNFDSTAAFEVKRKTVSDASSIVIASGNSGAAPDSNGQFTIGEYSIAGLFRLLHNNDVLYTPQLVNDEGSNKMGILRSTGSGIEKVFYEGDPAASNGNAGNIEGFVLRHDFPYIINANNDGDVILTHDFPGPYGTWRANVTVVDHVSKNLNAITRAGDPAPSFPEGHELDSGFRGYEGPVINDNGTMILQYTIQDGTNGSYAGYGLYMYKNEELITIATASYLDDIDSDFIALTAPVAHNQNDQFAFLGLNDTNASKLSLYIADETGYEQVAAIGDEAFGFSSIGYKYYEVPFERSWREQDFIRLNDNGMMVFYMSLINDENNIIHAMYSRDANGGLELIAYEGMEIEIAVGDAILTKTIDTFGYDSIDLNNQDLLAFGLNFEDGSSGIFTTVIPEPASGLMLLSVGAVGLMRRKRAS